MRSAFLALKKERFLSIEYFNLTDPNPIHIDQTAGRTRERERDIMKKMEFWCY
jgi:hypothetical protein